MDKLILLFFCGALLAEEDSVLSAIRADAIKKGVPESFLIETFSHKGITTHNKMIK